MTRLFHPSQVDAAPLPWEQDAPDAPVDPNAPRERHDAFTDARKCVFLKALIKTGCVLDACRATGVSSRTVYRHQESDPRFADNCRVALRMSGAPLELAAWKRAVEGVDREFACGGQVHVRRIYSDSLLRLLLQGSNPKKYGPRPGFTRKQLARAERRQIRREVEAEFRPGGKYAPRVRSADEVQRSILTKLAAIARHREPEKLAAGWTKTADGLWCRRAMAGPACPKAGRRRRACPPAIPCDNRASRQLPRRPAAARPRLNRRPPPRRRGSGRSPRVPPG